jgi:hypothetical protein
VIPVEGKEGRELHPAIAEFFVSIAVETACVDTKHGNAKEREGKRLWDGEKHVQPLRGIIATPMASPHTTPWKGRSPDDEWSFIREDIQ